MRSCLLFVCALLTAMLAACQPISPASFADEVAVPASVPDTSFAPTGIVAVDALATTIATRDNTAFASAIRYTDIPCSNAEGLGGPPRCPEGQPEGTVVSVLPIVESELYFVDAESLDPVQMLDLDPLYAVYEAPETTTSVYAFPELEVDWPLARYVLVYPHGSHPGAVVSMFVTGDGEIMRVVYRFGGVDDAIPQGVTPMYSLR